MTLFLAFGTANPLLEVLTSQLTGFQVHLVLLLSLLLSTPLTFYYPIEFNLCSWIFICFVHCCNPKIEVSQYLLNEQMNSAYLFFLHILSGRPSPPSHLQLIFIRMTLFQPSLFYSVPNLYHQMPTETSMWLSQRPSELGESKLELISSSPQTSTSSKILPVKLAKWQSPFPHSQSVIKSHWFCFLS